MKAEDTVISFKRMDEIDEKNATSNFTDALRDVAREQAEISFGIGYNQALKDIENGLSPSYCEAAKEICQLGQPVVELPLNPYSSQVDLDAGIYEGLYRNVFAETIKAVQQALTEAGIPYIVEEVK